jgi:hypothetical protein
MNHRSNVLSGIALGGALVASLLGCSPTERSFGSGAAGGGGPGGGSQASVAPGDCTPGEAVPCYDGSPATDGVGACKSGVMTCGEDRTFGACEGQVLPGVEDCKAPADEDCDGERPLCPLAVEWARAYPAASENNFAQAVAVGPLGSVTFVGNFNGTLELGAIDLRSDTNDGFVAQYMANGDLRWAAQVGGTGTQRVTAVATDAMGRVYIAGHFDGQLLIGTIQRAVSRGGTDAFVARFEPDGTPGWVIQGGDGLDQRAAVLAVNGAGEVVVGGQFAGSIALGGARDLVSLVGSRIFLFKLTADGRAVWGGSLGDDAAIDIGRASVAQLNGLALDAMGNPVIAGEYSGRIAVPNIDHASLGKKDCLVAWLDGTNGGARWLRSFGSEEDDVCSGVDVDSRGSIVVAGRFGREIALDAVTLRPRDSSSTNNLLFARLDPQQGRVVSGDTYGNSSGAFVRTDSRDNVILGGFFDGTLDFDGNRHTSTPSSTVFGGHDMYVVKLGVDGAHLASRSVGNGYLQALLALAVDNQDHIFIAGGTVGTLDTGTGTIGTGDTTWTSPLLAKLAP